MCLEVVCRQGNYPCTLMLLVDKEACTIKARHIFILMIYREGVMEFAYELPMFILMSGRV